MIFLSVWKKLIENYSSYFEKIDKRLIKAFNLKKYKEKLSRKILGFPC